MVTFQSIETQEDIDFDKGYDSYRNGEETLYNVTSAMREGYREAWYEDNRSIYRNSSDNRIDEAWEAHWETIKEINTAVAVA